MSFTITRRREFLISMGSFENFKTSAEVTLSSEDYDPGSTPEEISAAADEILDNVLAEDIEFAYNNTTVESYVEFIPSLQPYIESLKSAPRTRKNPR